MRDVFQRVKKYKDMGQYGKALNALNSAAMYNKEATSAIASLRDNYLKRFLSGSMLFIYFKIEVHDSLYATLLEYAQKTREDFCVLRLESSPYYINLLAMAPCEADEEKIKSVLEDLILTLCTYRIIKINGSFSPDMSAIRENSKYNDKGCLHTNYLGDIVYTCTDKPECLLEKIRYKGRLQIDHTPEISVIIPVYNNAPYLEECLDSVINQRRKDLQIIVVNDGSTDDSEAIIKKYAERDSRIQYYYQKNSGAAHARNRGIDNAHGRYIAFLDSDDFWFVNDALDNMISFADENQLNICGANLMRYEDGRLVASPDKKMKFDQSGVYDFSDYQFDYGYWRFIYRTDFIKDGNIRFPNYRRFQDPPFFVAAMLAAGVFGVITDDFYAWRSEHKKLQMNYVQVCDFVKGLTDNLVFSSHSRLAGLHNLCVARINYKTYMGAINKYKKDKYLKSLLFSLNSSIDTGLLRESGFDIEENYKIKLLQN